MFIKIVILLLFAFSSQSYSKEYVFNGDKADKIFTKFISIYSEKNKSRLIHGIPIHGMKRSILKSMFIVHIAKSVNPSSIDQLLVNYDLNAYSLECKKLYISMMRDLQFFDRIYADTVIVETNSHGVIQKLTMKTYAKQKGIMELGREYFEQVHIRLTTLLNN